MVNYCYICFGHALEYPCDRCEEHYCEDCSYTFTYHYQFMGNRCYMCSDQDRKTKLTKDQLRINKINYIMENGGEEIFNIVLTHRRGKIGVINKAIGPDGKPIYTYKDDYPIYNYSTNNLYVFSNEEIDVGDYVFINTGYDGSVLQIRTKEPMDEYHSLYKEGDNQHIYTFVGGGFGDYLNCKKIVASSDTDLDLPILSPDLILQWIENPTNSIKLINNIFELC